MQENFEIKYIDIHSHLNLSPLKEDRDKVIMRMVEEGVGTITIGVDLATSREAVEIARGYDFIWAGVGMHPNDNKEEVFDYEKYLELARDEKVVCIGECGLDYYRNEKEEDKGRQKELFRKHVELSLETGKPLMIHARPSRGSMDAYEDVLEILEEYRKGGERSALTSPETLELKGNFHFYVGDLETTKKIIDFGFSVSFDGPITFARDYDEVIRYVPLDMIHAETDAPFAAPAPYRGKTCEPWMVKEVVSKIAEIKSAPLEEVQEKLKENARRIFSLC